MSFVDPVNPADPDANFVSPGGRLPGEPDRAYHAWTVYRDQGSRRSLDSVTISLRGLGKDESGTGPMRKKRVRTRQIQEWSRRWRWVERVREWDAHLDQMSRLTQVEAIRDMQKRHVAISKSIQMKALEALRLLLATEVGAAEILRFLTEGAKLERLSMGEVTEAVRQDVHSESTVTLEVVERIVPVPARVVPALAEQVNDGRDGGDDEPLLALPDVQPLHEEAESQFTFNIPASP